MPSMENWLSNGSTVFQRDLGHLHEGRWRDQVGWASHHPPPFEQHFFNLCKEWSNGGKAKSRKKSHWKRRRGLHFLLAGTALALSPTRHREGSIVWLPPQAKWSREVTSPGLVPCLAHFITETDFREYWTQCITARNVYWIPTICASQLLMTVLINCYVTSVPRFCIMQWCH